MEIIIDLKNYSNHLSVFKRTAARAVIKRDDKYLLIYSKYGDYKFPGGGMKQGETIEETLVREVLEETGYHVILGSIKKYGEVLERRKGEYEEIVEMVSHYFCCDIEMEVGNRNLDEYEEEYNYQVVWMTLSEAIEKNKLVTDFDPCPWVIREVKVMERLIAEEFLNNQVFHYTK